MLEIIKEKKKILIGILGGLVAFGVVGMLFFLNKGKSREMVSPFLGEGKEGTEEKLVVWDDKAGFTFEYPVGLYVDPHSEDMENYAHLEITSTKEPEGKILILVSDTEVKTIEEWLDQEEEATMASILDSTLAETSAKKLLFKDGQRVLTAAIDPYEALFLLELQGGEGDFWPKIYDRIIKSFAFKPLSKEEEEILEESGGGEGGETGGNVVYEEEEVIE